MYTGAKPTFLWNDETRCIGRFFKIPISGNIVRFMKWVLEKSFYRSPGSPFHKDLCKGDVKGMLLEYRVNNEQNNKDGFSQLSRHDKPTKYHQCCQTTQRSPSSLAPKDASCRVNHPDSVLELVWGNLQYLALRRYKVNIPSNESSISFTRATNGRVTSLAYLLPHDYPVGSMNQAPEHDHVQKYNSFIAKCTGNVII